MRLVNFEVDGRPRLGVRRGDEVVDLAVQAPAVPADLNGLLRAGPQALEAVAAAARSARSAAIRPLAGLSRLPPNASPSKIVCLGVNFLEHAKEGGLSAPAPARSGRSS